MCSIFAVRCPELPLDLDLELNLKDNIVESDKKKGWYKKYTPKELTSDLILPFQCTTNVVHPSGGDGYFHSTIRHSNETMLHNLFFTKA